MKIGMIGLGKMGLNMGRRLLGGDVEVTGYDRSPERVEELTSAGGQAATSLADLVDKLPAPRVLWLMVPAGRVVDLVIEELRPLLSIGDIIVDGGNSLYKDTLRRSESLDAGGVAYVDAGTSGGVWGLEVGYCLMVGGSEASIATIKPALDVLAPPDGWSHVGQTGSGHYVKMIHNGIEYGMMQAYAEGFELLHASDFDIDVGSVANLWNQGSVIRSWLLELAERAFAAEGNDLESIRGWVADSGYGRWTVDEAVDRAVPLPVITAALFARFRSRQEDSYAARVTAALRNQFGGHSVKSR